MRIMKLKTILNNHDFILTEAAVIETLTQDGTVPMHPRLGNALLIYDDVGREATAGLYREFISVAREADVPMVLGTPTWRASRERLSEADIQNDVNGDAVRFMNGLREEQGAWAEKIAVGGLIACKNDSYKPEQGLPIKGSRVFHRWQIERLTDAGVDFVWAATLPAVPEATGIALAAEDIGIPCVISFVINRMGVLLDGSRLAQAFAQVDEACASPPVGYMINCSYPSFLNTADLSETVLSRLIGYQANASSLDHEHLDQAGELLADDIADWGDRMIELNRKFGIKILGGCCGTGVGHLRYLVDNIG